MQAQLPPGCSTFVQQLLLDTELIQLAKIKFKPEGQRTRYGGLPEILGGDPTRYKKTLLVLKNLSGTRISLSLSCWDQNSKRIAVFNATIPDASSARLLSPPRKGDLLELPKEITELATLQSRAGVPQGGGGVVRDKTGKLHQIGSYISWAETDGKPIDYGFGNILQDPVTNDPIGLAFGKVTRFLAKKRGNWLIASAGDNTIFGISEAIYRQRIVTDTDIFDYLEQSYLPETDRVPISIVEREQNWLTIRSKFPNRTLKTRYNRVAAKGVLATMRQNGCLSVPDGIGYISKNPHNPSMFSPDLILFQNSVNNAESQAPGQLFTDALPLLRDLGPTMLATSVNRPLQFRMLNPVVQGMIEKLVFSKEIPFQMDEHQFDDGALNGKDPTEVFPNGLPDDAIFEIGMQEEPAVLAKSSKGYYFLLTMLEMAMHEPRDSRIGGFALGGESPRKYVAFTPVFMKTYTLKLRSGNRVLLSLSSRGATRMPGGSETKLEGLPPRHLEALNEARNLLGPEIQRARK